MKDQYFGDARGYLKYHLLEGLFGPCLGSSGWRSSGCSRLRTAPRSNVAFTESSELPELTAFLKTHLTSGDRRVFHLRDYFASDEIDYIPWRDEKPYFVNELRRSYFRSTPDMCFEDALVFLDPDIGLTAGRPSAKHVTFHELHLVMERMSAASVAVLYQHFNRVKNFWERRAEEIRERVAHPVGFVADPAVGFYVIPKDDTAVPHVDAVLEIVASSGRNRTMGSCAS